MFQRLRSEYAYLTGALRALRRTISIAKNKSRTFPDVAEDLAARFGDRPALISDHETFTYRQYNARANRYARWARANGVNKGDTVALLMPNRPEFLVIWLGISRAGGVVALLNTNLTGTSLAHCINLVHPRHVIVAADLLDGFETAEAELTGGPQIWLHGAAADRRRLDREIEDYSPEPLGADERVALTTSDPCLYIYTSGTTGLPKAANINHYRTQAIMNGFSGAMAASPDDRMYVCLPLYHSTGGLIAVGSVLTVGGSLVIRERFSGRQFWDDVVGYDCTLFQYVGELCRYLLNSPTHPREAEHQIRLCCGNGLRPDIWMDFKNRFRIPKILEFYAATEGNAVLFNFDGMPGSVGRVPKWLERRFLFKVIEFDIETEREVRGADGFCIESPLMEPGEMISEIVDDPSMPSQRFEGYTDPEATKKKILHDVFKPGDRWFRTGDL
ncbi:MAG: AMP-binding protein, partial [Hyphomicrobiales bacterium]|nr:AMP-binding protein [Hyphomicrobiales bacterium]